MASPHARLAIVRPIAIRLGLAVALGAGSPFASADPVHTEAIARTNPDQHFVVARVDLTDPRVSVVVAPGGPDPDGPGPWETVLTPTSVLAKTLDLDLAVNTVFFNHRPGDGDLKKYAAGEPAAALNPLVIDGKTVGRNLSGAMLAFDKQNRATITSVGRPIAAGAWQAAGGSIRIVTDGKNTAGPDPAVHPRTAAGLTGDGRTLVLLVADGRRPGWATGLTVAELADEMIALGCRDAINFDGGGSSTMVAKTADGKFKVLNTPCDGSAFVVPLSVERPVAYVMGFRVARETK